MKLTLVSIAPRRTKSKMRAFDDLVAEYVQRSTRFMPILQQAFLSEAAFLEAFQSNTPGRTPAYLVLLDSRGKQLSSEAFAAELGRLRDTGAQSVILAIGPADGWSPAARSRADLLLSFGPMTLPHELARVILAEQVYRALCILAGHPYHSGH